MLPIVRPKCHVQKFSPAMAGRVIGDLEAPPDHIVKLLNSVQHTARIDDLIVQTLKEQSGQIAKLSAGEAGRGSSDSAAGGRRHCVERSTGIQQRAVCDRRVSTAGRLRAGRHRLVRLPGGWWFRTSADGLRARSVPRFDAADGLCHGRW